MANLDKYVHGKCMEMCPKAEIQMRERERLLHVLEMVPGTEKHKTPKACKERMVKAFTRSAAGKQINNPHDLRPPEVLLKTVSYLFTEVITADLPWYVIYDYITDRLMAVRQDMVVQDVSKHETIAILQPIVRFHALAAYKLCEENIKNFDATLNNNHLQETLKKLLQCYDYYNSFCDHKTDSLHSAYFLKFRPQFEALYVLFNMGNGEALRRALNIPNACMNTELRNAIEISLCCKYGNYVRFCRLITQLPVLLAAAASLHLGEMRRKAFLVMAKAYNSKNLRFPTCVLQNMLLYKETEDLLDDCKHFGIGANKENVHFVNEHFNSMQTSRPPRHETFIEEKLMEIDVPSTVLCL